MQRLFQHLHYAAAVAVVFHVDEVDDDDAAQVAQADLPDDLVDRLHVGLDDGVFQAGRAFADVLAGVDVNGHQRLGVVDDNMTARLQPHLGAQGAVDFLLHAHLFEEGRLFGVELDAPDQFRLKVADKLHRLGVFLFIVDPDGLVVGGELVAQDAFDHVEVAVEQGRRRMRLGVRAHVAPELGQVVHVAAEALLAAPGGGRAHHESPDDASLQL